MKIIWWEKANGGLVYVKSHGIQSNTLTTTFDEQKAEEITDSQVQTVKDWLVNNFGVDENKIHSGQKPPKPTN